MEMYCPEGVYQQKLTVAPEQTDARGLLTPFALTRLVCDAAAFHWAREGISPAALAEENLLLVLARTAIDVHRLPRLGEELVLRAWSGEEKWWLYHRRCEIYAADGEKLVSACSQWSLIDARERKLAPPHPIMEKLLPVHLPEEPKAPKMRIRLPELHGRSQHTAQPGEIDWNGHVNNAWYVDWAAALLPEGAGPLRSLWIEYNRELREGQTAELSWQQEGDTLYVRGCVGRDESFTACLRCENV